MRKKSTYVVALAIMLFAVAALIFPFSGGAAPDVQTLQPLNVSTISLPDYDAFGASTKRSAATAQNANNPGQPESNGGHLIQSEPRLGVPTFLWVSNTGAPQSKVQPSAQSGDKSNPSDVSRDYLSQYASNYRLNSQDVADARVAGIHDTGKGAIIVKYKQDIGGVEVFRDSINIILNRQYQLIALSGYLTSKNEGAGVRTQDFNLSATDALAKALQNLTGSQVSSSSLHSVAATSNDTSPYLLMTADKNQTRDFALAEEPARVKKVFYHLVDEYVPAYYVEADVYLPSASGDVLSVNSGGFVPEERAYSYVISATDGQVLFRHNLIAEQKVKQGGEQQPNLVPGGFTYKVWADSGTGIPYDTPAGNGVHPKSIGTPDGAQFPFLGAQNVQLPNFPFSQNDPWLAPGSTTTNGNNVEAFANLVNAGGNVDNGFGPAQEPPVDLPTGDHHAFVTAADQFIFNHQPDVDAYSATARQGAITQLFYDINFLHDWFYDAGFNEAAGNAQTNNFGRGGLGSDNIKGQVEDTASFSNANMLTPADGSRPRMRMYNFPNPANMLNIQAPAGIVNKVNIGIAQSGKRDFDINADIAIATFTAGPTTCTITNAAALAGKIAMFDFDNTDGTGCNFSTRISRIHATGALAALMVYTSSSPTLVANITGLIATHTKPIATVSWNTGQTIKGVIAGNAVTARLLRVADRDGAIDQQILFHEWGHYISNRLIGDGNGLNANYAGGLGEGWGDFNSMLLTVREDDTSTPSNSTWNGTYALATYATSGVPFNGSANQGYYFGIRRYPYSTDMTKNPLTFHHIQNGVALPVGPPVGFGADGTNNAEVHNTGEVWSMMLWECYAAMLRDTQGAIPRLTFVQAQDRMKNYVVAAYKMTPLTPTLLEARDAVLAAAFANDYNDGVLFAQAFAKRGAGYGAISPDRFSGTNSPVTESFASGAALTYVAATLDDTVNGCDADGYLDHSEQGLLKVTLKNAGNQNLFNTTATVSVTDANITFPNGATITFPAAQPGQSVTGSVTVAASNGIAGIDPVDFTINFEDSGTPAVAPMTAHFFERVNVDEIPASTATDDLEAKQSKWTVNINSGSGLTTDSEFQWLRKQQAGLANHVWSVPDAYVGTDEVLTSPVFTVDGSGSCNVQFDHSFGFEFDGGGNYDGGVIEFSVNGGAFTDMGTGGGLPNYNGTILNYSGDVNPLKGRSGFVQNSGGTIHSSFTKAIAPGSTVQIRFRAGSDSSVGATGWALDNISLTGVVETPFTTPVSDSKSCHPDPLPTPVLISLSPSTAPAGMVAVPYSLTVSATGSSSYTFSTTPVVLPPGLSGNIVGGTFQLSGIPTQAGTYLITVKATDGASNQGTIQYTIVIGKGTPTITWNNPADITYPTPLSGTQLNASANVPGVSTYTPISGTVLNAGSAQTLSVNFVPTDTTNYNSTSKNVSINVLKVTPTITWSNPGDIQYGTLLSAIQLNASSSVGGTLTYTPPAGNLLNIGAAQSLSVNFVPTDTTNFNSTSKNVSINVTKATPTITWNNPADITYGTALTATQLNAVASVPGVLTYTSPSGTVLNAGNAQTLSVNFVPTDTTNYNNGSANVSINVLKANQTINFGALSNRPLSSATFTVSGAATSNLPLTFAIFNGPATINSGVVSLTGVGPVTVRASQPGDGNYSAATAVDQTFTVTPASTNVGVSSNHNPSTLEQSVTFTATVASGAGTPTGTVTFKDAANILGTGTLDGSGHAIVTTSALPIGTHAITAEYAGDANNLAGNGSLAGGQLVNSPPNGVVQFSSPIYSVGETGGSVAITITRTGDTSAGATVDYATDDGSNPAVYIPCSTVSGTANERCDFTRATGTLHFAAGQASRTFTVMVADDSYLEGPETLQLILSNPSSGSQLGPQITATLTINDDDLVSSGNSVDNANAFVESLYHDFLNRTPDSGGLNFWTNEITSCGSNQACLEQNRVNVAGAFFLSIEFQQTGYLIERLYKTSYGDAQSTSSLGGQHPLLTPIVRLNEFLADTQEIGAGVFVGQPGWETALENNKVAFIDEFVLRSRFATAFPGSMTNAEFVDTLNANAGNPLTTAQRNQLLADLNGAVKTRAQVLRAVAENQVLVTAESNRAFVLMQYFGFLRRNPNDAPEMDYTGYDFWLTKLNQSNGNFITAEMVKAFINSAEYRQRFGN